MYANLEKHSDGRGSKLKFNISTFENKYTATIKPQHKIHTVYSSGKSDLPTFQTAVTTQTQDYHQRPSTIH